MDPSIAGFLAVTVSLVAGLAGLINSIRTSRSTARRDTLDEHRGLIEELQEDNKGLRESNKDLRTEVKAIYDESSGLRKKVSELEGLLVEERGKRAALGQRVEELTRENRVLYERIGALNERIEINGAVKSLPKEAVEMMQRIPPLISELVKYMAENPGTPPEVLTRLAILADLVRTIPKLVARDDHYSYSQL